MKKAFLPIALTGLLVACSGASPLNRVEADEIAASCKLTADKVLFKWNRNELRRAGYDLHVWINSPSEKEPLIVTDTYHQTNCVRLEAQNRNVQFNIAIPAPATPVSAESESE